MALLGAPLIAHEGLLFADLMRGMKNDFSLRLYV